MSERSTILLLTRPEPQSRSFLAECEAALGRSIPAIISPILRIKPVQYDLDLTRFETLILTSANAVRVLGPRLSGATVATVGEQTAQLAREFGADAVCRGENVDSFLGNSGSVAGPALHARGKHTRGCLAARLTDADVWTDECVVYDQVEQTLSASAEKALQDGDVCVPVFSPRSAALLSAHATHPDTRVLAISQAAADAWSGAGLVSVAAHPDRPSMRDLVLASI